MKARPPQDQLTQILTSWLTKRKQPRGKLLSLVRVLQHANKVVQPGRTFIELSERMNGNASSIKENSTILPTSLRTSDQTCIGDTFLSTAGVALVSYIYLTLKPPLTIQFRLMHQGPGVVEPSFHPSGFRGVVGSRHHGKKASTNDYCNVLGALPS